MIKTRAAISLALVTAIGCAARPAEPPAPATAARPAHVGTDPDSALTHPLSTQPVAGVPTLATDPPVAHVNGQAITAQQLYTPLVEAYGLNILLNLVQLNLAKQDAAKDHVEVSPPDVQAEFDQTLAKMFKDATKDDYPGLLDQFLSNQHLSRTEFQIVIETNAYLRKIAEPLIKNKITDDNLQEAFRQLYGETVQVRHIQCANLQEVADVKRRLATGEPFDQVAKELSRNPRTASLGGELPAFSRSQTGLPQAFKDAAFALKVGEISDPVQSEGAYHLIKLEQRFAPKAVKFDDVKLSIREDLNDRLLQATIKELRAQLGQQALQSMQIDNPVLKKQFTDRMDKQKAQTQDRDQIRRQLDRAREHLTSRPAEPEALPAPATPPTGSSAEPPATKAAEPSAAGAAVPASTQP